MSCWSPQGCVLSLLLYTVFFMLMIAAANKKKNRYIKKICRWFIMLYVYTISAVYKGVEVNPGCCSLRPKETLLVSMSVFADIIPRTQYSFAVNNLKIYLKLKEPCWAFDHQQCYWAVFLGVVPSFLRNTLFALGPLPMGMPQRSRKNKTARRHKFFQSRLCKSLMRNGFSFFFIRLHG